MKQPKIDRVVYCSVLLLGALCASRGQAQGTEKAEREKFFENQVRPLLISHCTSCHGARKQEGGLRLDSQDGWQRGGESGPLLDDQNLDASLVLKAIRHEELEMPPSGKLAEEKLLVLEQWLAEGAPWPEHAVPLASPLEGPRTFTDEERNYWFFRELQPSSPPNQSATGPIDSWIDAKLRENGLTKSPRADRRTLIRRSYLDLLGVLPTPEEFQRWIDDEQPDAHERMIDSLLQDVRYGQRWGRYWLDLVRFAESDGYKQDDFRPTAYRYRDYVVRAFNEDKPYAQFVREQLAGDEIDFQSKDCRDAIGYLRLGIYEYNQRDVRGQWNTILNDLTDVTGEVFLGLGYSCARCHDHKFDPLLQRDYYRLQATFAALMPRDDLAVDDQQHSLFQQQLAVWEESVREVKERKEAIEAPYRMKTIESSIEKFPPDVRPGLKKEDSQRSVFEKQLAYLAFRQIGNDVKGIDFKKKLKGEELAEWERCKAELDRLQATRPKQPEVALIATDVGSEAAPVHLPGDEGDAIEPGGPSLIDPSPLPYSPVAVASTSPWSSSGRRLALANWMVDANNRLTWRVIVNRIWQHHFGRGLVENASDFGKLTPAPSHPELLDWLAVRFADGGGSFKQLHRLIMTSETYCQQSYPSDVGEKVQRDPSNVYLSRFLPRRLDAEQVRDCLLQVSGELIVDGVGPSEGPESKRRSIYRRAMRNSPDFLLVGLDGPDGSGSVAKRQNTTTAIQALMMMNSDWTHERARVLSERLKWDESAPKASIESLYMHLFQRAPSESEVQLAIDFMRQENSWKDFCHALCNSNEFLSWE